MYIVKRHPRYYTPLLPILQAARNQQTRLNSSQLSVLECLVLPLCQGDQGIVEDYHRFLFRSDLNLAPITLEVLHEAAAPRTLHPSPKTPDIIHWATARLLEASSILTNDSDLAQKIGTSAILLDSLITP